MYKFAIYSINGFKGIEYYDTTKEALAAAQARTNISGVPWYVSAVKVG